MYPLSAVSLPGRPFGLAQHVEAVVFRSWTLSCAVCFLLDTDTCNPTPLIHVSSDWLAAAQRSPRLSPARTIDGERRLKRRCAGIPWLPHKNSKCYEHTRQNHYTRRQAAHPPAPPAPTEDLWSKIITRLHMCTFCRSRPMRKG